ncbi:unnamed protein product [Rhizoctonia solani]|uniref:Uncharacterized protein n=1 Tax=Rhizoctonia solani TaxID=456999 RepID=A0A8H3E227_9AGAM|nr:unnamed protein product [Rhizoctonia solani]
MRPTNKITPGPAGTSCLTCKRRPRKDETLISNDKIDIRSPNKPSGTGHTRQDPSKICAFDSGDAVIYDTFPPTRPKTRLVENGIPLPLGFVNAAIMQRPVFPTSPLLFELASRMSKSVPVPSNIQEITEYVISHFDRMLNTIYFKPERSEQIQKFQRMALWRMSTCGFARQGMLIDARIHDSILEGSHSIHSNEFTHWINVFEQAVLVRLNEPLTHYELQERLNDILEMFFTKSRLHDAATTYQFFCCTTPNFLQIIYSDSTMWPAQSDPTVVSIAHILASSSNYWPAYYMLMDVMGSMIYGVPQRVDYSTDIKPFHAEPHPLEWADCIPGEFMVLLAKINACRDQRSAEDWRDIERQLVSWEPRPKFEPNGLESWKLVAWLALQETWKQTLLMYMYLAVCGVSTDDPRIQSSLRQIFQLIGTIRRQDPPGSNVHFFAQSLITGICSSTEKQRRLVRERLGCAAETRFWMFRGPEIVPVLDHLWLGAGVEGNPVTWNDYLHSRTTVLPLSG